MALQMDDAAAAEILRLVQQQGNSEQAKKVDNALWQKEDVGIEHHGNKITLPAAPRKMSLEAAIDELQRRKKAEEEVVQVFEIIAGYPFDAAVAFVRAMREKYGWANAVATPTWLGPQPPLMLPVQTGPEADDVMQVPTGSFNVPGVEQPIEANIDWRRNAFCIQAKIKNRDKATLMELIVLTRQILARESIYKGKAIKLKVTDDGKLVQGMQPEFLYTKHVKLNELIFSDEVQGLVDTTMFTPIRHTDDCEKLGIPLKRGILLAGPYGTGKSLLAAATSKVCVDNGWTFILLDKSQGLASGLEFAKRYEPAVLFAEDIDRVTEERDEDANDLLNTIDGVLSKDAKVITVVTTNHPEKINKAMLRPGRLDAVIQVLPPDAAAAERLVHLYARSLIDPKASLKRLGEAIKGQIPATIREVVERSKLAMIARNGTQLVEMDLLTAATSMKHHLTMLNGDDKPKPTAAERLGNAVGEVFADRIEATHQKVAELHKAHFD